MAFVLTAVAFRNMTSVSSPVQRTLRKTRRATVPRAAAQVHPAAKPASSTAAAAAQCAWGGAAGGCAVCALFPDAAAGAQSFRRDVYHYVASVPAGKVATYASVAAAVGRPGASRAVGSAMRVNSLNIHDAKPRVPCHRVVRSDGALAGFNGGGCEVKADMLRSEGVSCDHVRIPREQLDQYLRKTEQ
jgi:methylated-DNA-[protein]-cysteine S-methyltransferase